MESGELLTEPYFSSMMQLLDTKSQEYKEIT